MAKKEIKKILPRVIVSGALFLLSIVLLIGQGLAWFSTPRASATMGNIDVAGFGIKDIACSFYRYDGLRYDLGGGVYDDTGKELSEAFEMPEYDTIITEKNAYNNVIMKVSLSLDTAGEKLFTVDAQALSGDTFGKTVQTENTTSGYLSDVAKISLLKSFKPASVTTNEEIYRAATAAFSAAGADVVERKFVVLGPGGGGTFLDKTDSVSFGESTATVSETEIVLWFNIEYEESLVKELCAKIGVNYGDVTTVTEGSTIPLFADLKFSFSVREAGAQSTESVSAA